jgi:hypothetical protein
MNLPNITLRVHVGWKKMFVLKYNFRKEKKSRPQTSGFDRR